jgi:ubiquinone/menaquinone biosynthesis C-methylase UbiE
MVYLNESEKNSVTARYLERFHKYGIHVDTLKSGGAGKQLVRHMVHASMFDLKDKHVLDVGCGIAMFYEYLRSLPTQIASYTGFDIVEPFLASNRERFPEARFENIDIFVDPLTSYSPDIVFMSQVFNNKYLNADNEEIAMEAIRRFFGIAKEGLAIDFMTSYVDFNEKELHYFSPEKMFSFAKGLTRTVALRHDYLPFEFTLFLYKKPTFDVEKINSQFRSNF